MPAVALSELGIYSVILSVMTLDLALHNACYVVAHFHYVLGRALPIAKPIPICRLVLFIWGAYGLARFVLPLFGEASLFR